MAPQRRYYSEADWEEHKATIRHLYLSMDKTLVETMDVMRLLHGFDPCARKYKQKLSTWRFFKRHRTSRKGDPSTQELDKEHMCLAIPGNFVSLGDSARPVSNLLSEHLPGSDQDLGPPELDARHNHVVENQAGMNDSSAPASKLYMSPSSTNSPTPQREFFRYQQYDNRDSSLRSETIEHRAALGYHNGYTTIDVNIPYQSEDRDFDLAEYLIDDKVVLRSFEDLFAHYLGNPPEANSY